MIWLARLGMRSAASDPMAHDFEAEIPRHVSMRAALFWLAIGLVILLKGEYGLAIGNIVGSNIFNLLAVIGIAAAIEPSALSPTVLSLHIFVMVAFTLVLFAMTYDYDGKADLSRLEGFALLGAYICYFGYIVTQTIK